MAPDVIDLISSSPPTSDNFAIPPSAQPPAQGPSRKSHDDVPDIVCLSDPVPIDSPHHADEADFFQLEERSPKRRRVSPSSQRHERNARPPIRNFAKPRQDLLPDPIEFTSSPNPFSEPSQPPSLPPHSIRNNDENELPRAISKSRSIPQIPSSDSDPFADTPPPAPRIISNPPAPADAPSSDPFASSPVLQRAVPRQAALSDLSKNTATRVPSPQRPRAFDNISSSAPEVCSFRSSPPQSSRKSRDIAPPDVVNLDDSDEKSDDELPSIADFDLSKPVRRARSPLRRSRSDIIPSNRSRPAKTTASTRTSAVDKAREREAKAAAKEAEKEQKRREREETRIAKIRDKERAAALAEVNKVRTDKKVSTPEMIVDLPAEFNPTVTVQVEALLNELGVQHNTCRTPMPNVIRWRRKVGSRFNEDMGYWEPIPVHIEDEKHVLVTVTADEFVGMALDGEVGTHVGKMRQHFAGCQVIYLLEGMTPWMRKNRNIRNRQFASGVRSQDSSAQSGGTTSNRRQRSAAASSQREYVSEDIVEDALLELQVMHEVLIHHTTIPLETAQWIVIFTQHISTIPYRAQRDQATLGAGFCMESGQVRTGDDAGDTYIRMLQEIARVTAPIAYGVSAEFSSVSKLVNGLEAGGPLRLEAVRKSANKDGAFSDRTIGQAVSRRLHKVFTGRDDASTDV